MNGYKFGAFKKNKFFYGKRLNVDDFKTEQSYMDAKRHMLNRIITGSGIVYGLNVKLEDGGKSVSVAPGLAIDGFGREIVVPAEIKKKLSDIEGVHNGAQAGGKYLLCICYKEDLGEPSAIAADGGTADSGGYSYGRIIENYKLELKYIEDVKTGAGQNLFYKSVELYSDSGVKLIRLAPIWVNPNEVFRVMYIAERTGSAVSSYMKFTLVESVAVPKTLGFYNAPEKNAIEITLELKNNQKRAYYSCFMKSLADPGPEMNDSVSEIFLNNLSVDTNYRPFIESAIFQITPSHTPLQLQPIQSLQPLIPIQSIILKKSSQAPSSLFENKSSAVMTVATPISEKFITEYFSNNYMDLFPMVDGEYVYLAEITVSVKSGQSDTDTITALGYGAQPDKNRQFVFNNTLLYQLIRNIETRMAYQKEPLVITSVDANISYVNNVSTPQVKPDYDKTFGKLSFDFKLPRPAASGVVAFDVYSQVLEKGDYDISEQIYPGAAYNVESVQLVWDRARYSTSAGMGEKLAYGVISDKTDNSFKIWYNVVERFAPGDISGSDAMINQLHFRWWAFSGVEVIGQEQRAQKVVIQPKRMNVPRQDAAISFEVMFNGRNVNIKSYLTFEIYTKNEDKLIADIDNNQINTVLKSTGDNLFQLGLKPEWFNNRSDLILKCTNIRTGLADNPYGKAFISLRLP